MLRSLAVPTALTLFAFTTPALAKDHHRPPSAKQCAAAKVEATGEKIEDKLECAAKARKKGGPVSQDCLNKAEDRFNEDFDDAGDNCTGNADAIEDLVDSCVNILSEDVPDSGRCAAKSLDAIGEAAEDLIRCLNRPDDSLDIRANHKDRDKGKDDDHKDKGKDKDDDDDDDDGRNGDGHHDGGDNDTRSECIAKAESALARALSKAGSCTDSDVNDDLEACVEAIGNGLEGNTTTTSSTSTVTSTSETTTSNTEATTTTSSSSTTSTTLASSCGNAIVDPGEECDPAASPSCPDPSSPGGAFLPCNSDCSCPGATTTTTSSTTTVTSTSETTTSNTEATTTTSNTEATTTSSTVATTTTSSSTTSTTLASSCGNAIVDPGEECDPAASPSCPDPSSPGGAFLPCNSNCTCPGASTTTTTSTSSTTSTTAIGSTTSTSTVTSSTVATTSTTSTSLPGSTTTTSSTTSTVTTSSSTTTSTAPTTTSTAPSTTTTSSSTTTSTAPSTTTTSSSTTTSTIASTCCSAERTTLTSSAGTLKVGGFAPFPFPAGVSTVIDAGAPDATCKHPVTVPAGGFNVPSFCIPALNYTSQVQTTGCADGSGDGAGFLWDGHAFENGGMPMTNVTKKADSADGVCDTSASTCADRDLNLDGDIDETLAAGGDTHKLAVQLDIPAHSRTWQDSLGCPGDGIYNPADGDALITEFDFILSPTTGVATGQFTDKNADGCALPLGSAGFGAPSAQCASGAAGPCTASGVQADGPCCVVGQSTTVATVGAAFSNSFPLYDLGFINVVPSTVQSCGAFVGDTCTVSTDACQF